MHSKNSMTESVSLSEISNAEKISTAAGKVGEDLDSPTDEAGNLSATYDPLLGFIYISITALSITACAVIVKIVSYIDPSQHSFVRNFGIFVGILPVAIYYNKQILGEKRDLVPLLLRAFASATALYLNFVAYRYLPLAEAAIILSTAPIFTTVLARILLKEDCGFTQITCLVLTTVGVLLSIRVPLLIVNRKHVSINYSYLGGIAAATASVFLSAIVYVSIRKLKHVHFSIPTMYVGFIGIVENGVINAVGFPLVSPYCGRDVALCMAIGLLGVVGNSCSTLSTQKQVAGLVAVERASMDILVTIVLQIWIFAEYPDAFVSCGAFLVMASLIIIGIKNWLLMMPRDSKARNKLSCFLT